MRDDVLIVGGGPAGLYAAQRLARRGLRVQVLEEHDRIGEPVHCTGILGTEAFTLPELPREAILGELSAAHFHSPAGYRFRYAGPPGQVCVVDRRVFDQGLARSARDAGARISTGVRVVGLDVAGGQATVRVAREGATQTLSARVCVLASGARYRLQRALGWGIPAMVLSAAQVEVAGGEERELDLFLRADLSPSGFAWRVPFSRGGEPRVKIGVAAVGSARRVLSDILEQGTPSWRGPNEDAPIVRPLPLGPILRTYGDHVLAIGDAAGLVKPTTGGGIYYGLLSATWAAETIDVAFRRGDFSAKALAEYERLWRRHLGIEMLVGLWFRRLVARFRPLDLDRVVHLAQTDGLIPLIAESARFNANAPLILRALGHPGVRQILVQGLLESLVSLPKPSAAWQRWRFAIRLAPGPGLEPTEQT